MATYLELKAQAEKLLAQAEEMREQEREAAIADVKSKIEAFGLTAQELGLRGSSATPAGRTRRAGRKGAGANKAAAKYRGPNGETWSGGRGRKPKWVTEALAAGKRLEDLAAS